MKLKSSLHNENITIQESTSSANISEEVVGISRREATHRFGLFSIFALLIFSSIVLPGLVGAAEEEFLERNSVILLRGQLSIKGKVRHSSGNPVKNASVSIIDKDTGGNGDDLIFTGKTDANGNFSGTTSEWRDSNTIPGPFGRTVEVPDALILEVRIKQDRNEITLPFFRLDVIPPGFSNKVEVSTPLVVAWEPPIK